MGAATTRVWPSALVAAVATAAVGHAQAAEVKVLSAGAVRAIVTDLAEAFHQETGHTVTLAFGTVGVIRQKLTAGEPVDVVIMSDAAIDETARQGAVVPGTRTDIARTGMGVAVREGAPKPDISTPEALKRALLAAKSLVYVDPGQGATSGIHFAGVLERLGIADALRGRPGSCPAATRQSSWPGARSSSSPTRSARSCPSRASPWWARCRKTSRRSRPTLPASPRAAPCPKRRARSSPSWRAPPSRRGSPGPGWTTGSEDMTTSDREPGFAGAIESRGGGFGGGLRPPPSHLGELLEGVGGAQ